LQREEGVAVLVQLQTYQVATAVLVAVVVQPRPAAQEHLYKVKTVSKVDLLAGQTIPRIMFLAVVVVLLRTGTRVALATVVMV
jgi:hypothetical protein